MKLTPYHKADLLTWIAILMGVVALFPMTRELSEAYWAPQFNTPAQDADWKFWAWIGWMGAMVVVGVVLPERCLRHAYKNWRTTPNSREDMREHNQIQQERRRVNRGPAWPDSERRWGTQDSAQERSGQE